MSLQELSGEWAFWPNVLARFTVISSYAA